MADEIDLSNDRIPHDTDREVARIAEVAAKIPPGRAVRPARTSAGLGTGG